MIKIDHDLLSAKIITIIIIRVPFFVKSENLTHVINGAFSFCEQIEMEIICSHIYHNMKQSSLFAILFITGMIFSGFLFAQNVVDNKTYRVTAYKTGNNTVLSTSNYTEVIPPLSIFIPNAFTPNGDGINDTFGVKGEGIKNFTMRIYNRWGEVVFESRSPKQQWDGTSHGKPAQSDVYVYQFTAVGEKSETKSGSVTLVR
jgi:gliding motility-associated-like protein